MPTITTHHDGYGLNDIIAITCDERDPENGGASHAYRGGIPIKSGAFIDYHDCLRLDFQHGPRDDPNSTPGLTDAAVLAVLIDRYEGFQSGPLACPENEGVLKCLRFALLHMLDRADDRHEQGVLGQNKPHVSSRH